MNDVEQLFAPELEVVAGRVDDLNVLVAHAMTRVVLVLVTG